MTDLENSTRLAREYPETWQNTDIHRLSICSTSRPDRLLELKIKSPIRLCAVTIPTEFREYKANWLSKLYSPSSTLIDCDTCTARTSR